MQKLGSVLAKSPRGANLNGSDDWSMSGKINDLLSSLEQVIHQGGTSSPSLSRDFEDDFIYNQELLGGNSNS